MSKFDFSELNKLLDEVRDQAADNRRRWLLVEAAKAGAGRLEHKRPTFALLSRILGVSRGTASRWHKLKFHPTPNNYKKLYILATYERDAIVMEEVTRQQLKGES